ncbi:AraC family transcriptional regulator [uncultured Variovorax sp.]|uniref:AraC family transcriptional regulator n=1 Tax=uncultured Variovorax sp. TaxID=114708 RepID=UPI0025CD7BBE|nr:AraC family transcriptional regulator [uncultured Variovorax sp.]
MNGEGAYGDLLGRYFELPSAPSLVMLPALDAPTAGAASFTAPFVVTRITCLPGQLGMKREIPPEDAFLATLHLVGMRHHETWVRGRPSVVRSYAPGALGIVDLRDEVASYLGNPLDALQFYVPHALVRAVARAAGMVHVSSLACAPGLVDPVMRSLGAAVLALFDRPHRTGSRVQQHLALAICAHLVRRFGNNDDEASAAASRGALHMRRLH